MSRDTSFHLLRSKLEVTDGTDAVPTNANDMQILAPSFARPEPQFRRPRDSVAKGSGSRQAHPPAAPNGRTISWSDALWLRGTRDGLAYAAANLPEADPWLLAAGFQRSIDTTASAETVTYSPAVTIASSVTEYRYEDGQLRKMLGGKATLAFDLSAGQPVVLTATRTGLYGGASEVATPAAGVFGSTVAPVCEGLVFTLNAYAAGIIRQITFATGLEARMRPSVNAADGLAPHLLRGVRKMPFSVTLEEPTITALNIETLRDAATLCAIATDTIGATQYNRFEVSATGFVIEDYQTADDAGIPVATLSGFLYDSAPGTNDALSLSFT